MPTASKVPLRSKPIKPAVTAITVKVRNAPPDFIPRGDNNNNNSTLTTTAADDDVSIPSEVGVSTAAKGSKVRLYFLL